MISVPQNSTNRPSSPRSWRGAGERERKARGSQAFSLPDLLVVMAVIMVLVALAVPIIAKSRAQARQARCASNLKEITRAVLLYADDFNATLPQIDSRQQMGV